MTSIGGGYLWPPVSFASDGEYAYVSARPSFDDAAITRPRYLTWAEDCALPIASFEYAVDHFVDTVCNQADARDVAIDDLREIVAILREERNDPVTSALRRREALLGFDAEEAPASLIDALAELDTSVGKSGVDELAAALPSDQRDVSEETAGALFAALSEDAANSIGVGRIPQAEEIRSAYRRERPSVLERPWQRALSAARITRSYWGLGNEPLMTSTLAERIGIAEAVISDGPRAAAPIGLAIGAAGQELRVSLRRFRVQARRFELLRMLGDYLFMDESDVWRPITEVRTARQQFQRAYGAEFLCPIDALRERLDGTMNRGPDIDALAEEFDVDTAIVKHQLANNDIALSEM
jgi:hypothetical protein